MQEHCRFLLYLMTHNRRKWHLSIADHWRAHYDCLVAGIAGCFHSLAAGSKAISAQALSGCRAERISVELDGADRASCSGAGGIVKLTRSCTCWGAPFHDILLDMSRWLMNRQLPCLCPRAMYSVGQDSNEKYVVSLLGTEFWAICRLSILWVDQETALRQWIAWKWLISCSPAQMDTL